MADQQEIIPAREPARGFVQNHDAKGRFGVGNLVGRGNPRAARVAENRLMLDAVLARTVTPERLGKAVEALLVKAEGGDVKAFKELLDRLIGKADAMVKIDQKVEHTDSRVPADIIEMLQAVSARTLSRRSDADDARRLALPAPM